MVCFCDQSCGTQKNGAIGHEEVLVWLHQTEPGMTRNRDADTFPHGSYPNNKINTRPKFSNSLVDFHLSPPFQMSSFLTSLFYTATKLTSNLHQGIVFTPRCPHVNTEHGDGFKFRR
jgi:hypothetical protein